MRETYRDRPMMPPLLEQEGVRPIAETAERTNEDAAVQAFKSTMALELSLWA
ncbi:MAG: hypothetical protein IPG10_13780 [Flavobacteriales bacterium]|nr:hypothetical protein [Flavobacteriales bacterium]